MSNVPMKIVIVHPDLGIGGAERLIVDAAVALIEHGNDVVIYTSHHDPNHCFPETKKFKVVVVGDWLPRSFLGSFYLLFAALRSIYLAFYLLIFQPEKGCDLIIADQITFHLPILKFCSRNGVLFYCHFPDKLLAPKSGGFVRKGIYRRILDWAEEICMAAGAREIVVNSRFTQMKFKEAFSSIKKLPEILYPGVHIDQIQKNISDSKYNFILSLNRFERKKDLNLAIESFKLTTELTLKDVKLILAGGYDARVLENREHLMELQDICDRSGLKHLTLFRKDYKSILDVDISDIQVLFLPSISEETKEILLQQGLGLLYTPSNEHFGIVPIEAMSQGLPVIAINSGGPKETILDSVTGYLCEPNQTDISIALCKLIESSNSKDELGLAGKKRVSQLFSLKVFGDQLNKLVRSLEI